MTGKFDAAEAAITKLVHMDSTELFNQFDVNRNGILSLAEIDKWIVESWHVLDNKPALMRAYHATVDRHEKSPTDAYVRKHELAALLSNVFYFNKLFEVFQGIDKDNDRRLSLDEFYIGADKLGVPKREATEIFHAIDADHGGKILFVEFCAWYSKKQLPGAFAVQSEHAAAKTPKAKAKSAALKPAGKITVDAKADISTTKYDALEQDLIGKAKDASERAKIWAKLDADHSGTVTLAEFTKFAVATWSDLAGKDSLILRAFKVTVADPKGATTAKSVVRSHHLKALLANTFYFLKLDAVFQEMNTSGDDDDDLDFDEFFSGLPLIGLSLTPVAAKRVFDDIDKDKSGNILFEEFAAWVASTKVPVD